MELKVDPKSPLPLYAQIFEQLKRRILSGLINPTGPLPSVRQLADQLNINSLTVQKAYKLLEDEGLISIRRGVGAFVAQVSTVEMKEGKKQALEDSLAPVVKEAKALGIEKELFKSFVDEMWSRL